MLAQEQPGEDRHTWRANGRETGSLGQAGHRPPRSHLREVSAHTASEGSVPKATSEEDLSEKIDEIFPTLEGQQERLGHWSEERQRKSGILVSLARSKAF